MMTPQATHALATLAIIALILWRLYARIRRSIGRQRLHPVRAWITVSIFPVLLIMLGVAIRSRPLVETSLLCGIAIGIGLGILGLHLTRFEASGAGLFYTPSAHLGIALSTLLGCRIAYRLLVTGLPGAAGGAPPSTMPLTPLTLLLVGALAGYYCAYALGLLRWAARARGAAQAQVPSR